VSTPTQPQIAALVASLPAPASVAPLLARARAAHATIAHYTQAQADEMALAVGWAIMQPQRNEQLARRAVEDTGLGNVADKVLKNHRKTLGLLRDLQGAISVGVLSHNGATGITEIARPVGVVAAITPSTNPGATPANNIINALKCKNAIVIAPSPKGYGTAQLLLGFVHEALNRIQAPLDLVQLLPDPVSKESTYALMREADLVVATGSPTNIRAAYSSGTPALGVGTGNVASIIDSCADVRESAAQIMQSKTFDNATSCSSENSVVVLDAVYGPFITALSAQGTALLDDQQTQQLQAAMFPKGKLSAAFTAKDANTIAALAQLTVPSGTRILAVHTTDIGAAHPFSGEKLSPVLAIYRARDFADAQRIIATLYAFLGAGHSVAYHGSNETHIAQLGNELPVARVIVNQAHCIATGGAFNNGLPFSLSMGCGTWGGNGFSDNLNYKHFMNTTRIVRPIPETVPKVADVFATYWAAWGQS
jgi:sulfoacetaldehyde dehydrogenase